MESFYGGRQGAPFAIVKRFDGIDIPNTPIQYKWKYLAFNPTKNKYYYFNNSFIFENSDISNISSDILWKKTCCNGGIEQCCDIEGETIENQTLPTLQLEGMNQNFNNLNIVGIGEYVLIDESETNAINSTSIDHGKIFYRDINNFKYIGTIRGVKGEVGSGFKICTFVSILPRDGSRAIPPEELMNDEYYKGWCIGVGSASPYELYAFDYKEKIWYLIGDYDVQNAIMADGNTLQENLNHLNEKIAALNIIDFSNENINTIILHNNFYRGQELIGNDTTYQFLSIEELYDAVSCGNFDKIYVGDTITLYNQEANTYMSWIVLGINSDFIQNIQAIQNDDISNHLVLAPVNINNLVTNFNVFGNPQTIMLNADSQNLTDVNFIQTLNSNDSTSIKNKIRNLFNNHLLSYETNYYIGLINLTELVGSSKTDTILNYYNITNNNLPSDLNYQLPAFKLNNNLIYNMSYFSYGVSHQRFIWLSLISYDNVNLKYYNTIGYEKHIYLNSFASQLKTVNRSSNNTGFILPKIIFG